MYLIPLHSADPLCSCYCWWCSYYCFCRYIGAIKNRLMDTARVHLWKIKKIKQNSWLVKSMNTHIYEAITKHIAQRKIKKKQSESVACICTYYVLDINLTDRKISFIFHQRQRYERTEHYIYNTYTDYSSPRSAIVHYCEFFYILTNRNKALMRNESAACNSEI